MSIYNEGARELQDRFDSRRIAGRLEEVNVSSTFSDYQRALIDAAPMFWLATADADGWPDVSYKGGMPAFVRVVGEAEVAFPNYDGNGMCKSLGNVLVNPKVGLLFIRVAAERIFLNCPRYLHRMELAEYSAYAPRAGHTPPVPDWKRRPEYRDHLPARDRAALAADPPGEEGA